MFCLGGVCYKCMDTILVTLLVILSTVSGIPILRLDVCSESEATFTCLVTESTVLHWNINFLNSVIERVLFNSGIDSIGRELTATNDGTGVMYNFNLTSMSPLTSTVTTDTPTDLCGATVQCSSGMDPNSADNIMDTLVLSGPPYPFNITMTIKVEPGGSQGHSISFDGYLSWSIADLDANHGNAEAVDLNTYYSVILTPNSVESDQSILTTSNTSIWLTLFSDQEYNISVTATNCVGTSKSEETLHIIWDGHCPCPIPWLNVSANVSFTSTDIGPQLVYSCLSGLQPQREMVSICTSNGTWYPNLANIACTHAIEDQANGVNTDVIITYNITITNDADINTDDKLNQQNSHGVTVASTIIAVSVVFMFLVVLSLISVLFIVGWLHKRKQDTGSETQTVEQSQNEITHIGPRYQDDDLDYSYSHVEIGHNQREDHTSTQINELQNPLYQNVTIDHNPDENLNLDSLLIQLRVQVIPKWHQFGMAIGVPEDILQQYSSYPADERLIEVLNYWLNNHQNRTWRDVAKVLCDIELNDLAEGIMNVYETGCLPVEVDVDDSDSDDNILLPLPIPSDMLSSTS